MVLWTLRFDSSIHVRFINDETAFRFEYRVGSHIGLEPLQVPPPLKIA
jgi:hypothetical protein